MLVPADQVASVMGRRGECSTLLLREQGDGSNWKSTKAFLDDTKTVFLL